MHGGYIMNKFLLRLNLQFFSADGAQGGGYELTSEQLDGLSLGDDEVSDNDMGSYEGEESLNSDGDTLEETNGENNAPSLIDIPGIGQVELDTIKQWQSGNMMHSDYTKKTQELADQRRQLENDFAAYRKLDEIFQTNPQLEQQFIAMLQEQNGAQNPQNQQNPNFDIAQNPMFQQMQQQLQQQQSFFEQMQQQQAQERIQQEWTSLRERFPDVAGKEEELAKFADANGYNLETAYKLMNFDNVRQQTQTEMVKNNMKKKPANTIKPQNNAPNTSENVVPDGNYEKLVDFLVKKDLKLSK